MVGRGATLPDGCKFAGGGIRPASIRVDYTCPGKEVVTLDLIHPRSSTDGAIRTKRFAISVFGGTPRPALLDAVESLVRDHESAFQWGIVIDDSRTTRRVLFSVLLALLALLSVFDAMRMPGANRSALRNWIGPLVIAAAVFLSFQGRADPPAHGDTAVDLALGRDCVLSGGASCVGHAASALGLLQGQGFTYALALWLFADLPIAGLGLLAAAVHGVAAGLLHHTIALRFGSSAWLVSSFAPALAIYLTGFPIIWNPSWFTLPIAVAFLSTLAIARGSNLMGPFCAGAALALTAESHLLFGTFVVAVCMIALVIAKRPLWAAAILAYTFYLAMMVISPLSFPFDLAILRAWLAAHQMIAFVGIAMFAASVPAMIATRRRLLVYDGETRELAAAVLWLAAGLGIGFALPLVVSRPLEIRYCAFRPIVITRFGNVITDFAPS